MFCFYFIRFIYKQFLKCRNKCNASTVSQLASVCRFQIRSNLLQETTTLMLKKKRQEKDGGDKFCVNTTAYKQTLPAGQLAFSFLFYS